MFLSSRTCLNASCKQQQAALGARWLSGHAALSLWRLVESVDGSQHAHTANRPVCDKHLS
eukprot:122211-Prymnesium_polylepis.1